jgi:molecular chaperone GrpE
MDFWDPYDRMRRRRMLEQQRRKMAEENARRAEEERLRRQQQTPPKPPTPATHPLLERFEQELAQARRERDEWADRYKTLMDSLSAQQQAFQEQEARLQAEEESQRERLRQEADQQRERIQRNAEQRASGEIRSLLARLLDVADNFDRVLAQSADAEDVLVSGVKLTYRDFRRALELAGVERLESMGQAFDPAKHEAVATIAREGAVSGTIVEEIAAGYLYKGTLLRPAKVIVAA